MSYDRYSYTTRNTYDTHLVILASRVDFYDAMVSFVRLIDSLFSLASAHEDFAMLIIGGVYMHAWSE